MPKIVLLIAILFVSRTYAQQPQAVDDRDSLQSTFTTLTQLHDLPVDKKSMEFYDRGGFCQLKISLHPDHQFQKTEQCCSGRLVLDSGYWKVDSQSRFELKTSKRVFFYYLFQYGDCLFFMEEKDRPSFYADFEQALKKRSNRKPLKIGDEIISVYAQVAADCSSNFFFWDMSWKD